ncbi:MAG: hypothetical protein JRJ12_03010 [Deltaproteobacteria bacterium]|nr:hypothetical protein [Deltaproteobacteria bacterium]MBW2070111.1 hypothetical protein [Deltaproteobacteria bacterium]
MEDFTRFVDLNPQDPKAYHISGLARLDCQDPECAIRDFDKAIELDPTYIAAYLSRGTAHAEAGTNDKAQEDLSIATTMAERVAFDFMMKYNISWRGYVDDVEGEDIFAGSGE